MSKREKFEAGREGRRSVLRDAGRQSSADHMDALVRYLKSSGHGQTASGRVKPLSDAEIRTRAVDLVTDAGGEATAAIVAAGSVLLRGRIGCRTDIALLERKLLEIPGVTRLDLRLEYDIDDV